MVWIRSGVRAVLVAVGGWVALSAAGVAAAQPPAPKEVQLPAPLTREAVRELVARLSDAEVRQLLIAQLDRAAPPGGEPKAGTAAMTDMSGMVQGMDARVGELARAVPGLPGVLSDARLRFLEGRGFGHLGRVVLGIVVLLAVGLVVERAFRHLVRDARRRLEQGAAEGLAMQAGRLVLRLALDLLGLAAFAAGGLAIFFAVYQGHPPTRLLVLEVLAAVVLTRLVALVSRLLLAPDRPELRLLPFGDAAARRLHAGVVRLAAVYAFSVGGIELLRALGAPQPTLDTLYLLVAVLFLGLALDTIWRVRGDVAALIRGDGGASPLRRLAADLWAVLATGYLTLIFVTRVVEVLSGGLSTSRAPILSVVLLVALPLADMLLCRIVDAWTGGRAAAASSTTFGPVLEKAVHIVVTVAGLLLLADLWHLDLFALAERGLGGRISGALLGIAVVLLVAYMLWELARTAIDRRLAVERGPGGAAEPGEEGGAAASRLRTLLPLFRMALLAAILVMATLSVLAALGINIVPLLAGASVIGLAIGFGSQTLVRDIVSGVFFLMDDAFRLGEYIEVGSDKGTVEKISIRSLQLRHHRGALNVLPYGEIKRLRNNSRDWMIMTLEFRLTYDTDLVKVKKILKRIGEELAADPELGPDMLQPLKSQGVMATEDSALLVRAKFMAKPTSAPYLIRREAYTRILKAFKESGIQFAHRQVTVNVPPNTPAGAAAAGAAAAVAAAGSESRPSE